MANRGRVAKEDQWPSQRGPSGRRMYCLNWSTLRVNRSYSLRTQGGGFGDQHIGAHQSLGRHGTMADHHLGAGHCRHFGAKAPSLTRGSSAVMVRLITRVMCRRFRTAGVAQLT
jgi:hypothetical protein